MHPRPLILFALLATGATPALAYHLEPMSRVVAPTGTAATQRFEVVNDGPERIAVQISMQTLARDESYRESNQPADDDFLVYPTQMILAPGSRQTVRVTWLGDPAPAREQAYRFVAEQVPIELLERAAAPATRAVGAVRLLVTFRASVFVRPRDAVASVKLERGESVTEGGGAALALTVRNAGAATANLTSCKIHVEAGGHAVDLGATPLAHTRILAGQARRYVLPWPAALKPGPVIASVRCDLEP